MNSTLQVKLNKSCLFLHSEFIHLKHSQAVTCLQAVALLSRTNTVSKLNISLCVLVEYWLIVHQIRDVEGKKERKYSLFMNKGHKNKRHRRLRLSSTNGGLLNSHSSFLFGHAVSETI